jgi:hypothetical protein
MARSLSAAQRARNALGAAARRGDPAEQITEARRNLAEAKIADAIRQAVDSAPPLTDAARARLARLLIAAPAGGDCDAA